MKKIGCFISYDIPKYDKMGECAYKSFVKWNPEVETHFITPYNMDEYNFQFESTGHIGIDRYMRMREVMFQNNYDKIICLGADTITTSRLDEFLDDDDADILATLNYPNQDTTEYWTTGAYELVDENGKKVYDSANINADVVCFNNLESLEAVLELSINHKTHFGEQGGLNEMAFVDKRYKVKIIDAPYPLSKVVYNCRSKGVFGTGMNNETTPQSKFYVRDDKLFTHDNKHIKVFHYAEGLGLQPDEKFVKIINDWNFKFFNEETRDFYKNSCDCMKFFNEEFNI